jgi:hypothetical protein
MINEVDVVDMCDKPKTNVVERNYTLSFSNGQSEVVMNIPGDRFITDMMEEFEKFLRACGHKLPSGCHIGFVEDLYVHDYDDSHGF